MSYIILINIYTHIKAHDTKCEYHITNRPTHVRAKILASAYMKNYKFVVRMIHKKTFYYIS